MRQIIFEQCTVLRKRGRGRGEEGGRAEQVVSAKSTSQVCGPTEHGQGYELNTVSAKAAFGHSNAAVLNSRTRRDLPFPLALAGPQFKKKTKSLLRLSFCYISKIHMSEKAERNTAILTWSLGKMGNMESLREAPRPAPVQAR